MVLLRLKLEKMFDRRMESYAESGSGGLLGDQHAEKGDTKDVMIESVSETRNDLA